MWKQLKCSGLAINQNWPSSIEVYKKSLSNIAIQINGKTRVIVEIKEGSSKEEVQEIGLKNNKVHKHIVGKTIKKIIFVPDKILNIVI